jgi:plastocyanin
MKLGLNTLALVACLAGAACGGGGDATTGPVTPPPNGNTQVSVTNDAFTPSSVTIKAGTAVTWTWNSCSSDYNAGYPTTTCVDHQIGFDDGQQSAVQNQGSFDRSFATAGTYPYHCLIHGVVMSGTVVVQ